MGHYEYERDQASAVSSERSFGAVFVVFLVVVAAARTYRGLGGTGWLAALAVILAAVTYFAPHWLVIPNRLWMGLARLLARVTNPIVLGLLFYGVMTPYGWIARKLQKSAINFEFDPAATTYWVVRNPPGPPPNDLRKQY